MNILKPSFEILYLDKDGLDRIEYAARTCYKSEDKSTEDSAPSMVKRLIDSGHEAMLEHGYISVKFTVDRGVSHEIVRHRMASFAQESTRYCNYSKGKFNNSITCIDISNVLPEDMDEYHKKRAVELWFDALVYCEKTYLTLIEMGVTPEIARSVLPNSLKTEIVVTANYREWRHILNLRAAGTTGKPHPQMKEVMIPLLDYLHKEIPVLFDDIWEEAYKEEGFNYDKLKDERLFSFCNETSATTVCGNRIDENCSSTSSSSGEEWEWKW